MLFSRRIFTALLSTSVVLPLSAALATDLNSSASADLLAALRDVGQGSITPSYPQLTALIAVRGELSDLATLLIPSLTAISYLSMS
jgi:hypothetical protein